MLSLAVLVGLALAGLTAVLLRSKQPRNLPPGPPGLPLLGNLLQMPANFPFLKFREWSKVYGPILAVSLAGQRVVVLSSVKVAGDVLDRQSAHTSNRPAWIKINQFLTRGNNVIAAQQGETWRRLRKATHEVLNIRAVTGFQPMQEQEAAILMRDLVLHPDVGLITHLHRTSSSIAWRALYGGPPLKLDTHGPAERLEEMTTVPFKAAIPGNSLVDLIPPLRHLYARWGCIRKGMDDWFDETTSLFCQLYNDAQDQSALGNPCVSNNLSKLPAEYEISETTKAWTPGVLFTAGQDTTATTLRYFVLAMLLHPEVVHHAQHDLDSIVGDQPPTFKDEAKLPYISAIIKEVCRWRPAVPGGLPHAASDDFEYAGYVIPKGTWLIDNTWAQTRDTAVYEDPERFDPSRFLTSDGRLRPGLPDTHDDWLVFGHGRRICPGRDLAIHSLFITFAYLLWAFDFCKKKDANGNEETPDDMKFVDNFVTVQPAPFRSHLIPRFPDLTVKLAVALQEV